MREKDDREIIEEAQKDSRLFGLIYLKYFKKLYTYIWFRVGKSASVAQDLAQETFLRAFKHLNNFKRSSASYLAYLFKIAKNLLVSYYRKKKELPLEAAEEMVTIATPALNKKIDHEQLLTKMDILPAHYQEVLRMKYIDELSIKEIANHMNKTENAVKLTIYRAKKTLKSHIEKDMNGSTLA